MLTPTEHVPRHIFSWAVSTNATFSVSFRQTRKEKKKIVRPRWRFFRRFSWWKRKEDISRSWKFRYMQRPTSFPLSTDWMGNPPPSLLSLTVNAAVLNLSRINDLSHIPDHIVLDLFAVNNLNPPFIYWSGFLEFSVKFESFGRSYNLKFRALLCFFFCNWFSFALF